MITVYLFLSFAGRLGKGVKCMPVLSFYNFTKSESASADGYMGFRSYIRWMRYEVCMLDILIWVQVEK